MNVLVISDTHKRIQRLDHILKIYEATGGIQEIIHCGDHITDAEAIQAKYPQIKVHKVPGNCDASGFGSGTSIVVEIEGVPIFITHGHNHHVKFDYDELYIDAKAHDAKVICFGHTHSCCKEKKEGILLINPGSLSEPRDTMYPSFAIMEIENGKVKDARILQMTGATKVLPHPYF
ncbi:MAG: metallophosphoesterase family protein [Cellulosilyticaceae bacterium]